LKPIGRSSSARILFWDPPKDSRVLRETVAASSGNIALFRLQFHLVAEPLSRAAVFANADMLPQSSDATTSALRRETGM